jgi:hypothetical protein
MAVHLLLWLQLLAGTGASESQEGQDLNILGLKS